MTSIPVVARRGEPYPAGATSAWISTASGRVPSSVMVIALPATGGCSDSRKKRLASATSTSPSLRISSTPTSSVEPYRFLAARSRRVVPIRSPSR